MIGYSLRNPKKAAHLDRQNFTSVLTKGPFSGSEGCACDDMEGREGVRGRSARAGGDLNWAAPTLQLRDSSNTHPLLTSSTCQRPCLGMGVCDHV